MPVDNMEILLLLDYFIRLAEGKEPDALHDERLARAKELCKATYEEEEA